MAKQNIIGPLREQSDWEQNDENRLGFIKNKPFYDARTTKEVNFFFDGDLSKHTVVHSTPFETIIKVSELVPTVEEASAGTVTVTLAMNGQEVTQPIAGIEEAGGSFTFLQEQFIVIHTPTEADTYGAGIYMRFGTAGEQKFTNVSLRIPSVTTGELKTIDPKFLPDNRVIYYTTPDSENNGVLYRTSEKVDENMVTGEELKEAFENGKDIWVCVDFMGTSIYLYANSVAFAHDTDAGVLDGMIGCTMLPVGGQVIQYLFTTFNS